MQCSLQQLIVFSFRFATMLQKTRSRKHTGEVGSGVEGGEDTSNSTEYIAWNKDLADTVI